MKMKRLGETAVSPDGKWLAYSVTTVNLDQNSKTTEWWLQAIAGGEPQKLTVGQPGDSGVEFAPDGHSVLFLSGRDGGQQIWRADFDAATGSASNAKKLTSIATDSDNAKWSPDGKSIVFTSAVYPDCPAITTADFDTGNKCNADRDAALSASKVKARIFTLLSVEAGKMRDLTPNDTHDVPPDYPTDSLGCGCAFSPDGKELAITENNDPVRAISTNADIFTLDLTNPAAKPVKVSTSPGGDFSPAYSPDGKYLAWRSQARASYESDKFRLMLYDREAKTTKNLLPKFDRWVEEFAWASDSKAIYFVSENRSNAPVFVLELLGQPREYPEEFDLNFASKPVMNGTYSGLHPLPNGTSLVMTRMAVDSPGEVNLLDTHMVGHTAHTMPITSEIISLPMGGTRTPLTHLNDALLSQLDLPKMESFWFTAKDTTKLQGFIIRPPGFDAAKKYPVKFLIHGGPQGAWGDSWSYRWNAELFAANGYVVVMINPRGSTGYGQAIVDGVNGDWGGKPFTDLMEGLDYAEQHYSFIDKDRECALGASYGGYMANWVLGHTARFKCIVSHDGMFNPESAYGTTEELWFNEWEFKGKPWDYYGKPDSENPFRKWAPMLSAKNFKTPTLVIHGQLDYRLDVSEGFQLFDTLQRLGVPSKMLYFPDEGHWVLKPQNSQLWYKTVNDWVDQWTTKAASSH
jgi:dipeptidyl aminopeptidase/acylaminoacyl peptidase